MVLISLDVFFQSYPMSLKRFCITLFLLRYDKNNNKISYFTIEKSNLDRVKLKQPGTRSQNN